MVGGISGNIPKHRHKTDKDKEPMYAITMLLTDVKSFLESANLSENTVLLYEYFLRVFFNWTVDASIEPDAVTPTTITKFFKTNSGWSNSTRRNAVAAIRSFYRWKYGGAHAICAMKIKRVDAGPQRTLDEKEVSKLFSSIDTSTIPGIRDLAIVTLMVDTGLRASEICNIEMRHLDPKGSKLKVRVKGGDIDTKCFFDYTSECVSAWLTVRSRVALPRTKTVFCSVSGKKPGTQLTRSGILALVKKLCKNAGMEDFSPHALRRTFATLATENGAPTRLVQAAGGWKSIRMVEHYTRQVKIQKIKPYSPVNRAMGVKGVKKTASG
jgi:site-specific recombinase XerD